MGGEGVVTVCVSIRSLSLSLPSSRTTIKGRLPDEEEGVSTDAL